MASSGNKYIIINTLLRVANIRQGPEGVPDGVPHAGEPGRKAQARRAALTRASPTRHAN